MIGLSITASKFGLGAKVLKKTYENEKRGLVPNTKWKRNKLGKGWVLGETLITGIGQGYIQVTPLQLCLMTAQLANGGHKIYPKITVGENDESIEDIKDKMQNSEFFNVENIAQSLLKVGEDFFKSDDREYYKLFKNPENIKLVMDAMFGSTNEIRGTSYSSRIDDPKYQFAGKNWYSSS